MSWTTVTEFDLIPSEMCAGQPGFSPYIPESLIYGVAPGTYRISYISGAVRSHNTTRFQNFLPKHFKVSVNNIDISTLSEDYQIAGTYYETSKNQWTLYTESSSYKNKATIRYNVDSGFYYFNDILFYKNNNEDAYSNGLKFKLTNNTATLEYTPQSTINMNLDIKQESDYEYRWNKSYDLSYNLENIPYDYTYFPEQKYNVFQCQFGTLPGFTPLGSATKEFATLFSSCQGITQELYPLVSSTLVPLSCTFIDKTTISFWYTDDCAPCVEGKIRYKLERYIENDDIVVNALGVLAFDINTLETDVPEYYGMSDSQVEHTSDKYLIQYNNLDVTANRDYICLLDDYNTLGYNKNYKGNLTHSNMNLFYNNVYTSKYYNDIYWKLVKTTDIVEVDLITMINGKIDIPLFAGYYTLIPSKSTELNGSITYDKKTEYLTGNEYTFSLDKTSNVTFNCNAYLYKGSLTQSELINKLENVDNELTNFDNIVLNTISGNIVNSYSLHETLSSFLSGFQPTNLINNTNTSLLLNTNNVQNNFYLFVNTGAGVAEIITDETIIFNFPSGLTLLGPYSSIETATNMLKEYCVYNDYNYEKITDILYTIG